MALDSFTPDQKREYVIIATAIGIVLSTSSTIVRFYSKIYFRNGVRAEEWFMLAGLMLSYGIAASEFYGLTTGLGQHEADLTKAQKQNFQFSVWLLQRFQPPTIFCIKTSIIIFYYRIFSTDTFRRFALGIWIYTLIWTIEAFLASMLECTPIAFFWDKSLQGHCVPNPLITIGLTNGVLSAAGDVFILFMPLPVLLTLQINRRRRWGLIGIFTVGLFVVVTSFLRWIALLGTTSDVPYSQAEAGIWTYLECAMGVVCANMPPLAPLVRFFAHTEPTPKSSNLNARRQNSGGYLNTSRSHKFRRMKSGRSDSEVELRDNNAEGIRVNKKVEITRHSTGRASLQESYIRGDIISNSKVN